MADEKLKDGQQEQGSGDVEETQGGADQSTEEKTGDNGAKGNNGTGNKQGKTFTQEEVNRMMTREKNQGRMAALKELGIDPKDTKSVAMVKALIESQKTDEQKAGEEKAELEAKQTEAVHRALVAEAKAEAMMIGVQPQYVDDVIALAMAKVGEDGDLKATIGEYKTKYPMWFGSSGEDDKSGGNKTGQKGTGSSIKGNSGKEEGKGKSLGARLAAQRKSVTKSSYWGNTKR